jgi:adenosylhomocysteine nucleosidase
MVNLSRFVRRPARTLLLIASAVLATASIQAQGLVALVAAYPNEKAAIIEMLGDDLEIRNIEIINGTRFVHGEAFGRPVVIFLTRVSIPNAAMTTQLALSLYPIETLLFSGVAGGVNPELAKGDVSIPLRWAYHSEASYWNEDPNNPGQYLSHSLPRSLDVPNFGFIFPAGTNAVRQGLTEPVTKNWFEADRDLLARAVEVAESIELTNAEGQPARIHTGGSGVAGPVFVDNARYREWVYQVWGADVLDMESTAIAHVCWTNNVPFLIIRSLSDLAGAQEGDNEFPEFARMAERNAARFLVEFFQRL